MKILVVSDSHGRNTYLERVYNETQPDMLIHLGDLEGSELFIQSCVTCPVEMVPGNNDYFSDLSREKIIQIGKYKVLLTHGHRYRVHFGTDTIRQWAYSQGVDIVMFGHTHVPHFESTNGITIVNPGSISQPRQAGHRPTYIIMELDEQGDVHFALKEIE